MQYFKGILTEEKGNKNSTLFSKFSGSVIITRYLRVTKATLGPPLAPSLMELDQ